MSALECDSVRLSLGALVLGALPPDEREQVRRHVDGCARCQAELAELTPLPGLLNLVRPEEIPVSDHEDVRPSPRMLESLLNSAESALDRQPVEDTGPDSDAEVSDLTSRRRTRVRALAAMAAAALVAAAVWVVVLATGSSNDSDLGVVTASATGPDGVIKVTVELTPDNVGTAVAVEVTGADQGHECDLVVVTTDGDDDVVASWTTDYVGTAQVVGHTRFATTAIERLDITTDDGVLLTIPVP